MSRKIHISKYQGNTHYSIHVEDSYGQEHHLGFFKSYIIDDIERQAEEIWSNEVEPEEDLMANAIANMIELDKKSGILKGNSDGLD